MVSQHLRLTVPVGPGGYNHGSPPAPVTLLEYGNFEYPYCQGAPAIIRGVEDRLIKHSKQ